MRKSPEISGGLSYLGGDIMKQRIHQCLKVCGFTLLSILLGVGLYYCITTYIGTKTVVVGSSMYPTYEDGDKLWTNKTIKTYEHGDIIVFEGWDGTILIKRVIGLPGDTLRFETNSVYRNNERLDEPYVTEQVEYGISEISIENTQIYVMGDNRNYSKDSRHCGIIYDTDVVGIISN